MIDERTLDDIKTGRNFFAREERRVNSEDLRNEISGTLAIHVSIFVNCLPFRSVSLP